MENITYDDWTSSVSGKIEQIRAEEHNKYVLENLKLSLKSINATIFKTLLDSLKSSTEQLDSCELYILFCLKEGEVYTKVLKFIAVNKLEYHSVKYVVEGGQNAIFSEVERRKYTNENNVIRLLQTTKSDIDLSPNVLFISTLKQKRVETSYIKINKENTSSITNLIWQ